MFNSKQDNRSTLAALFKSGYIEHNYTVQEQILSTTIHCTRTNIEHNYTVQEQILSTTTLYKNKY